jgi:hypothetical protein
VGDETGKHKAESRNGESGNGRFPIVSSLNFSFQLSAFLISAFLSQLRPEGRTGSGFEFRGYAAFLQNAGFFKRVGS